RRAQMAAAAVRQWIRHRQRHPRSPACHVDDGKLSARSRRVRVRRRAVRSRIVAPRQRLRGVGAVAGARPSRYCRPSTPPLRARRLARRLASASGVTVLNSVPLNQVIVTFGTGTIEECNELTRATVAQLQADNICLAGGADWHQHFVLRLSLIAAPLVETDLD